jgi:hypothetical protein
MKSAEIGDILGCSHDTVIRKAAKEGISLAAKEGISLRLRLKHRPEPLAPQVLPIAERIGVGQAVAALSIRHCRWPIGDPVAPDFHFCSAPRINMQMPYCQKHQDIAMSHRG